MSRGIILFNVNNAPDALADAVKELRRRASVSQQAMAVRLGTSVRTVAHWEAGRRPSYKSLVQLGSLSREFGATDLALRFDRAAFEDAGQPANIGEEGKLSRVEELWCEVILELLRDQEFENLRPKVAKLLRPVIEKAALRADQTKEPVLAKLIVFGSQERQAQQTHERHNNKAPKKRR